MNADWWPHIWWFRVWAALLPLVFPCDPFNLDIEVLEPAVSRG